MLQPTCDRVDVEIVAWILYDLVLHHSVEGVGCYDGGHIVTGRKFLSYADVKISISGCPGLRELWWTVVDLQNIHYQRS